MVDAILLRYIEDLKGRTTEQQLPVPTQLNVDRVCSISTAVAEKLNFSNEKENRKHLILNSFTYFKASRSH